LTILDKALGSFGKEVQDYNKALENQKQEMDAEKTRVQAEMNRISVYELEYTYFKLGKDRKMLGPNSVLILAHTIEHAINFLHKKLAQRGCKVHNINAHTKKCDVHYIEDQVIKKIVEVNTESVRRENILSIAKSEDNKRLFKMSPVKGG
jgi:phosphoenolpyruvate-protein kinase (PTS system EI component)